MSDALREDRCAPQGLQTAASLQQTLSRWRQWIHLEATRTCPFGQDPPTPSPLAQEQRERCEVAARKFMGLKPGRADPVDMHQLQALLRELEARCRMLRSRLAEGEEIMDGPLCGVLATQIAGCLMLLWPLVGGDTGPVGPAIGRSARKGSAGDVDGGAR